MPQISKYPLKEEVYSNIFDLLLSLFTKSFDTITSQHLLEQLFTPTEKIVIAKRLGIAILLKKGYSYQAIQHVLKVSKPTIAHINMQLKYHKNGLNYFTSEIIKDKKLAEYFDKIINTHLQVFSKAKGSGVWKYLRTELQQTKITNDKSKMV